MLSIRPAQLDEIPVLSDLAFRSKAHWGYDVAFMEQCRDELTFDAIAIRETWVADIDGTLAGLVRVRVEGDEAEVWDLFVAPEMMGRGVGRALWDHAVTVARGAGATSMRVEADPNAVPFYERMGARVVGAVPSGSIPGRSLPLMQAVIGAE